MRRTFLLLLVSLSLCLLVSVARAEEESLKVSFGEQDITPVVKKDKPVYMAGFGQNRKATGVHDKLFARAIVLQHGEQKIALVCVDVIGFFQENVEHVRGKLKGFTHVLVSSTHNHEGPDTLGLWGPNPFNSGIDGDYLKSIEAGVVKAIEDADKSLKPATAIIGTATAPELLHDSREPDVKHDELVALSFNAPKAEKDAPPLGLLVQWNCHPETLDSKNTEISADFVGYTVAYLHDKHHCPVVYLNGTVGGLLSSLKVEVKNEKGELLDDGTFEKTERYGQLIGELAEKALKQGKPVKLFPMEARSRAVFVPMVNPVYMLGKQLGVLKRQGYIWKDDPYKAEPAKDDDGEEKKPMCIRTEIGYLRLGELEVACFPGEIYPELVLDKVQDPVDPGADFPDAPIEPAIYKQLKGKYHMMIGLANDEIGYIIPKRQWDEKPPYCYGRKKAQYGEINSLGPDTAPILCKAFKELVEAPSPKR
jgi:hypothetical protein